MPGAPTPETPEIPDETLAATPESAGSRGKGARELTAGSTLGKYKLERVLGSGGMGVVWAAQDPDLERAVALKVLRHENATTDLRKRLLREARAMARLKHPNVLTVYEVGSEGDRDFIAMELVDGASLEDWAATHPSAAEIWDAIVAAGNGLAAAHRAGLVHRDFKPHNVLRGTDGRVLVTDFGLARGHGDDAGMVGEDAREIVTAKTPLPALGLEATLDATDGSSASSKSPTARGARTPVDVPLTQTGVLVGTPAYMAPEQFRGAAPDPRTDQFAYCVTAWQLLAGERPFRGTTLDELRTAASGGVAGVKATLPRAVRKVLTRGLDPDPAKRWPDLGTLLAALARARARPRRLIQIAIAVVVVAALAALVGKLARDPEPRAAVETAAASACTVSPEDEIARAWSPARRARFVEQFGNSAGAQHVAAELDDFATRWIADYRDACATGRTTKGFAKLGCLLGERDEVAGLGELIVTVPREAIEDVEMGGILPRPQACDGDAPVTPPTLPDDPARRTKIQALRLKLVEARFAPDARRFVAGMPALLAEAEATGWDPIVAEAHQAYAVAAQRVVGLWEVARDHYKLANQLARRTHHYHLEADTWIGLLDAEIDAASDPTDDKALLDLVAQARVATHNAGEDPVFFARITRVEGVYAKCHGKFDEAIAKFDQARASELEARDVPAATRFAMDMADALLLRDHDGDLDRAWAVLVEAERVATAAKLSRRKLRRFDQMMAMVAAFRGDYAAAHAHTDRAGKPDIPELFERKPGPQPAPTSGRVVDADGKPAAGATVVAWRGVLPGDAERVFIQPPYDGEVVTADADGRFTVGATPTSAVIAELPGRRSSPRLVGGDATLALTLGPTRTMTGKVTSDAPRLGGVVVTVYFQLAGEPPGVDDDRAGITIGTAWVLGARVQRDRTYKLVGLPAGDATLRLDTQSDPNQPVRKLAFGPVREGAEPRWPSGPSIDAIVHDATDRETLIWVLRGRQTAKTHAELRALADRASEVLVHPALVVGIGDQTVEGMKHYARGDRHAVFVGQNPGEVTVCIADIALTAAAKCQTLTLRADAKVVPVELRH